MSARPRSPPVPDTPTTAACPTAKSPLTSTARGIDIRKILTDNGSAYVSHAWRDHLQASASSRPHLRDPKRLDPGVPWNPSRSAVRNLGHADRDGHAAAAEIPYVAEAT